MSLATIEPMKLEDAYPSVELVYPIAIASYDVLARRLEGLDGKLQTVLTFMVTVSLAFVGVASGQRVPVNSVWFFLAVAVFVFGVGFGTFGRLRGDLRVLNPGNFNDDWLTSSPWIFKNDMISFAGRAFEANEKLILMKWRFLVTITCLFALEAVFLACWVLTVRS